MNINLFVAKVKHEKWISHMLKPPPPVSTDLNLVN